MPSVYFIGDTHFGHKKIIDFGRDRFKTIEEHDEGMIELWNDKVRSSHDLVWHLGDVALGRDSLECIGRCNGRKKLIMGNHDTYHISEYAQYFDEIYGIRRAYDGMVMSHAPIHPSQLEYRWKANIHGHIHKPEEYQLGDGYINVCADVIGLQPISLDELRNLI